MFRCDKCDEAVPPLRLRPVKEPARHTFNHEVLIDVIEAKDAADERYSILFVVCSGTLLRVVATVRPEGWTPSPRKCAATISASWVAGAGWPVCITCYRGVHNRGWDVRTDTFRARGVPEDGRRRGCRADRQVRTLGRQIFV